MRITCLIVLVFVGFGCSNLKDATSDIKDGMSKLSEGLDKVDPLALKQLLKENAGLRTQFDNLQAKMSTFGNVNGSIVLDEQNRVYCGISSCSGKLRVSAWIDGEGNSFINQEVIGADLVSPPMTFTIAGDMIESLAQETWGQATGKPMNGWLWNGPAGKSGLQGHPEEKLNNAANLFIIGIPAIRQKIDLTYRDQLSKAWLEYSKPPRVAGVVVPDKFAIDRRLGGPSGKHVIFAQITPLEYSPQNQWSITFDVWVENVAGKRDVISQSRIDSFSSPGTLNHPLDPIVITRFETVTNKPRQ